MESETYCVLYGEIVLAKEMSLAMALLLIEALMMKYHEERELAYTIKREAYETQVGGVEPELEKAQPEIKETKPTADKQRDAAKRQQKRKPFDTGKMIALLRAGWNVPKIADEMGVSEPTIYNHMKKEGITK